MSSPGNGSRLPTGTLTFLFTDIEGSTRLAHELGDGWLEVLGEHNRIIRDLLPQHGGIEVNTAGDSFFLVFGDPGDAVAFSVAAQRAMADHDWSPHPPLRIRMGMHTGEGVVHDDDYAGLPVHAASRVESAAAGGQVLLTEATLEAAVLPVGIDALDLGPHRLKDLPSELRLYQVVAEALPRDFPPVQGIDVLRNNVPRPPSNFVGRTEVLQEVHRLLDDDRLVSLVGPGGTGKTRLAVRLASERLHRYPDGVWFVELDGARDETTIAAAIGAALGLREERGRSAVDALLDHARGLEALLVLDNCEHVVDDAALVTERLLHGAPGLRILATTREALRIDGERLFPVAPLSVEADDPASSEAVELLVDRARRVRPDLEVDEDAARHAVAIARHLDGLPLALELAAASALELDLADIAEGLDDRFGLLVRGRRTALDRQRTLRGAIDWSYDLLDPETQRLFEDLGVFPGEFDGETAAAVCGDGATFPDRLDELARKSLVAPTALGRLRMLESIRAYARERLADGGRLDPLAERHARWFAEEVLADDPASTWARSADGWELVHDDLAQSLRWLADQDRPLALDALVPLQRFWMTRGLWTRGRALTDHVLDATSDVGSESRLEALSYAGRLALIQGDTGGARRRFEEHIELAGRRGGEDTRQAVLGNLGAVAAQEGDLETAEDLYLRSLDAARSHDDAGRATLWLAYLADISRRRGDLELAWERASRALEEAREVGRTDLETPMVNLLGSVAHQRGEHAAARRLYADALDRTDAAGEVQPRIYLHYCLATLALDEGAPEDAVPWLTEALRLAQQVESPDDLIENLEATARLAALREQAELGARLLGAVDALREETGFPRPPAEESAYEALLDGLRRVRGPEIDGDLDAGRSLDLEDATALALTVLEEDATDHGGSPRR